MVQFIIKVLLEEKKLVYRDLSVPANIKLIELHQLIKKAFGFKGNEFSSFMHEDETLNAEVEIPLENLGDEDISIMADVQLSEIMKEVGDQLSYTYDYASEWVFHLELIERKSSDSEVLPEVIKKYGEAPSELSRNITGEDAESILMNAILGDELADDEWEDDFPDLEEMDSIDDYEEFL